MKKSVIFSVVAVFFTCMLGITAGHAAGPEDACAFFTKTDAESLLNAKVASQKSQKVSAPAGNLCTYNFKIKGSTYSVKIKLSSSEEIKAEGIFASARDVFDRQKKARMASADSAKKMRMIPALGDEAFWNGYDLWMVRANHLFVILAHPPLPGAFPSSDAMEKAREAQDLSYSQKAAIAILSKMK